MNWQNNKDVKCLLVHPNLFDRTVVAKRKKTRDSKEKLRAFLTVNTVDKGTEFSGEFENLSKADRIQTNFTMSETKPTLAECTKRSLKNIFHSYMEDYGYKYFQKRNQFLTTMVYRRSCLMYLFPQSLKNPTFCPFCSANHDEVIENLRSKTEAVVAFRSMTYPIG